MSYSKIIQEQPAFGGIKGFLPDDIATAIGGFTFEPSPTAKLIHRTERAGCIDKGRFFFDHPDLKYSFQSSICLRCGGFDDFYVYTPIRGAECQCPQGPKEDHHGNLMIAVEVFPQGPNGPLKPIK